MTLVGICIFFSLFNEILRKYSYTNALTWAVTSIGGCSNSSTCFCYCHSLDEHCRLFFLNRTDTYSSHPLSF